MKKLNLTTTTRKSMTKKAKQKKKSAEQRIKESDMLKDEAAIEINERFRNHTLWIDNKKKKR